MKSRKWSDLSHSLGFGLLLVLAGLGSPLVFSQPAFSVGPLATPLYANRLPLHPSLEFPATRNLSGKASHSDFLTAASRFPWSLTAGTPKFQESSKAEGQALNALANLPLCFEPNVGQADPSFDFLARGSGYTIFVTHCEMVMRLTKNPAGVEQNQALQKKATFSTPPQHTCFRWKFNCANPKITAEGVEKLPGVINYFQGNDPSRWQTRIPTFGKVRYPNLYPGIDLVYYGNQGKLEYDLVVTPGADPKAITLTFEGNRRPNPDGKGNLLFQAGQETITLAKPVIYQTIAGIRRPVEGMYTLSATNRIGFSLAAYNRKYPLIIDPVLLYATRIGGSKADDTYGIAIDSAGNAYITGDTDSTDFPTINPLQTSHHGISDAFVTKISADGRVVLFSTYLGGSAWDRATQIAVDPEGNAYLTGSTDSADFPTRNPLQANNHGSLDSFITKISPDGSSLLFSTYLGGSRYDNAYGIAVDSSGNAYITVFTSSTDFPTKNPLQASNHGGEDACIIKIKADGKTLLYSTYLGGSKDESIFGIAVDSAGNAYISGSTDSPDFPIVNPLQASNHGGKDAFVSKISADGKALLFSTYLGGSGLDWVRGIAVDSIGNACITGYTDSTDFPTMNPLQANNNGGLDAFITKITTNGSALLFSTYLGGTDWETGNAIAFDPAGNVYITGHTDSIDFPTVDSMQSYNHIGDVFVAKISGNGSYLLFSTHLGDRNNPAEGKSIAVDSASNAYITASLEQDYNSDYHDAFIFKIDTSQYH